MSTILIEKYISKSWIDPRIEVRTSSIQGRGMFACEPIRRGEVVVIWGGEVFSESDLKADKARDRSVVPIGEGLYLGDGYDVPESLDEYMNHHCDSNVWMQDEVTLVAKRDIAQGEELTIDYAMWETDPAWQMECNCGSPVCRQSITGNDWQLLEVQMRYKGHFSPYVAARIKNSSSLKKSSVLIP